MSPALQKSYVYGTTIEKKYVYETGLKVIIQKNENFIIIINNINIFMCLLYLVATTRTVKSIHNKC